MSNRIRSSLAVSKIVKRIATLGLTQHNQTELLKISFAANAIDPVEWKGDVALSEKDMAKDNNSKFQDPLLQKLDSQLEGSLSRACTGEDFTGKSGESIILRLLGPCVKTVGLVGLIGLDSAASPSTAYLRLGEAVAVAAKSGQASNVAIAIASSEGLSAGLKLITASAIASGTVLWTYGDRSFESISKKRTLESVDIFGLGVGSEIQRKLKQAEHISSAVIFGKNLVNAPGNVLTLAVLAEEARRISSAYSDVLMAKILNEEQCKELKMGSFLGVAAASANPPQFIHICYKPPGSAAVLGVAKALGQIKPAEVEVHFVIAACENMMNGTGMRPGDIVTASNGKTIEVNNTDAKGVLILADALVYTCNLGVDKIIDLATQTEACVDTLGTSIAGIFTPSDELAKDVVEASEITGEKLWRLPLEESYWEFMKSGVADVVNTGDCPGGAITAVLKQFVNENVQWMHIDMAGPVWNNKKKDATVFGIATLAEWVLKQSS